MGWTDELYKVYEENYGKQFDGDNNVLLCVSHSTAQAQIEITLDEKGNFIYAQKVDDNNAMTIIPVTEDSGARSSGVAPMPFADKLKYIAGDYSDYVTGKEGKNDEFFKAYKELLEAWKNSGHSHPAVEAVFAYISKCEVIKDLIRSGVLETDESSGMLKEKVKITATTAQEDSFVRFIILYDDLTKTNQTWLDTTLYDSFASFYEETLGEPQLCYATGRMLPATYKHPAKIRNSGDKAKLISSNDTSGFTYRGRFSDINEAVSISYDFSQKMHNALKWLISRQSLKLDDLTVVTWASAMQDIPKIQSSFPDIYDDESFGEEEICSTEPEYCDKLKKLMFGYEKSFDLKTKVMVMGLDSAISGKGRISIGMYYELGGSEFLGNIEKWHRETAWLRFYGKLRKNYVGSFSLYEIIRCAFGTEQGDRLVCKNEKDFAMKLIPCIVDGRRLPYDIVRNVVNKASNPLAYSADKNNHRVVLETACGMIRKYYIDKNGKDVYTMSYDPNEKNRSYLFGCLLAIADKAESDTYDKGEKASRITNARRYWNTFSQKPYTTWKIIEDKLQSYFAKLGWKKVFYEKKIQEILDKMSIGDFSDNSPLEPLYLLGYHHFMSNLYSASADKNNEEE